MFAGAVSRRGSCIGTFLRRRSAARNQHPNAYTFLRGGLAAIIPRLTVCPAAHNSKQNHYKWAHNGNSRARRTRAEERPDDRKLVRESWSRPNRGADLT